MGVLLLALQCAAITVASFSCGLTGLGQGIIFQTCWSLLHSFGVEGAGDLQTGVALAFLLNPVTTIYLGPQALREGDVRWELVVAMAPGMIFAMYAGTACLAYLDQDILKRALGVFFFAFALWRLTVMARQMRAKRIEAQRAFMIDHSAVQTTAPKAKASQPQEQNVHDADAEAQVETLSLSSFGGPSLDEVIHAQVHSVQESIPIPTEQPSLPNGHATATTASIPAPSAASASISIPIAAGGVTSPALSIRPPSFAPLPLLSWSLNWWRHSALFRVAVLVGVASGFLEGLFGTGGPPSMMLFACIEITKGEVRGTSVWGSILQLMPGFISLLVFGVFSWHDWPIYCLLPFFCLLGTWGGNVAFRYVDVGLVLMVLQALVLLSSMSLTSATDGTVFGNIMLVAYFAVVAAAAAFAIDLTSLDYRFLRTRPQIVGQWLQKKQEMDASEKQARLESLHPVSAPLVNADGSPMWHE